jgi:hypothetical protein
MTIVDETPLENPVRTEERGVAYIPLHPAQGMRSVAIGPSDALTLWASNARIARRAASLGDVNAWTEAAKASDSFLEIAIELDPRLEVLRAFPPPIAGQGEA